MEGLPHVNTVNAIFFFPDYYYFLVNTAFISCHTNRCKNGIKSGIFETSGYIHIWLILTLLHVLESASEMCGDIEKRCSSSSSVFSPIYRFLSLLKWLQTDHTNAKKTQLEAMSDKNTKHITAL